jgi:hypothetical protein
MVERRFPLPWSAEETDRFTAIGHDETDPITLTLFATSWLNHYAAAYGCLGDFIAR